MPPQSLSSETNIKLPFSFIFFSFIGLVFSQILLITNGHFMTSGAFRGPAMWSAAHLIILGWALMTAMGAMYQLVPVAFLTKIWNETFGFIQFFVTAIGVLLFAGTLYWAPQKAFIPGIITLLGLLMFIFQMLMTLRKQAKPNILTAFVGTGLFSLLATISLGITMAYSLSGHGIGSYNQLFETHLLLGITGWFTLLIFGLSYKMVPMFSLSHGFPMVQARYVYGLYVSGLIITILSIFSGNDLFLKLGFLLLFIGFSTFSWHVSIIIKKRLKKKLDKPFSFALSAIGFGNLIHLVAFVLVLTNHFSTVIGPLIYSYLFLWIILSILGYLYKIVPFLWWTHKYSQEIGKKAVPSLKQMTNEKIITILLSLFILSVVLVFCALTLKIVVLFNIGQCLFSVVFVSIAVNTLNVLRK